MSDAQRAARLTDPVCHSLGIVGLIGGALAGEQLMHGIQTAFGLPDPVTGMIGVVGSANVLIGGLPAVRTVVD